MYTFSHDGVTITVQPAAQGRHTVVFLNGLFGGGWIWEPVVATLTAAGYGTVVTTEPLAAHQTAEDIPALLQSISLLIDTLPDASPILCGNSMGAFVAMELAAAEPSRWAGVILSGAPGLGDEPAANNVGSALRDPSQKLGDRIADRLIHDKELITPALVQRCTEALTPRILLRAGRALRATRGYDARPLLGRIDIPVLLVFGACDEVSSPAKWRAAVSMFPDADYVEIAGAGHSPMLEKPDEFSAHVTAWLDTIHAPALR
jgi:2-hydroxy-6-oxonona-2,4-dienedioate hydrolase